MTTYADLWPGIASKGVIGGGDGKAVEAAIERFRSLNDPMLWGEIGSSFNCTEAEIIFELLRALGMGAAAEALAAGHSMGDMREDAHYTAGQWSDNLNDEATGQQETDDHTTG